MSQIIPDVFTEVNEGNIHVHDFIFDRSNGEFYEPAPDLVNEPVARISETVFGVSAAVVRPILSRLEILDSLQGRRCVCGASKGSGRSHCPGCYHVLPPEKQKALYKRFRDGYEHAFLDSLIWLTDAERTDVERIRAAVPVPKDFN